MIGKINTTLADKHLWQDKHLWLTSIKSKISTTQADKHLWQDKHHWLASIMSRINTTDWQALWKLLEGIRYLPLHTHSDFSQLEKDFHASSAVFSQLRIQTPAGISKVFREPKRNFVIIWKLFQIKSSCWSTLLASIWLNPPLLTLNLASESQNDASRPPLLQGGQHWLQ